MGGIDILDVVMVMPGPGAKGNSICSLSALVSHMNAHLAGAYTFDVAVVGGRVYHLQAAAAEQQLNWVSGLLHWRNHLFTKMNIDPTSYFALL